MPTPKRTQELLDLWVGRVKLHGNSAAAARVYGASPNTVQGIINEARALNPMCLPMAARSNGWASDARWATPDMVHIGVAGKVVLTGGDLHVWDEAPSLAWRAFVAVAHEIKPDVIVLGGDMIDGARVSRHPRIMGDKSPPLMSEIDALHAHLAMLPDVPARSWVWGNHDQRVDNVLANVPADIGDYAGRLKDRFPAWSVSWGVLLGSECEVRHRFRSGVHSTWNNALNAGISLVSFHTHQQKVTPVDDRRGRRYGVEPGCLMDPWSAAMEYGEGSPNRHSPGFAVLTFDDDERLLPPELCEHSAGRMYFRGKVIAGEKPRIRVKAGGAAA